MSVREQASLNIMRSQLREEATFLTLSTVVGLIGIGMSFQGQAAFGVTCIALGVLGVAYFSSTCDGLKREIFEIDQNADIAADLIPGIELIRKMFVPQARSEGPHEPLLNTPQREG